MGWGAILPYTGTMGTPVTKLATWQAVWEADHVAGEGVGSDAVEAGEIPRRGIDPIQRAPPTREQRAIGEEGEGVDVALPRAAHKGGDRAGGVDPIEAREAHRVQDAAGVDGDVGDL